MIAPRESSTKSADLMRYWASLYKSKTFNWSAVTGMIQVAEAEARKLESKLSELLSASDAALQKISLREPLRVDAGLNRWLKKDREEAYSDWLAWILEQLGSLDVLDVLRITDAEVAASTQSHFKVERECCIPDGRLDLLLTLDNSLIVVIEVKKSSAEVADTAKQSGYHKWLQEQPFPQRRGILLITDAGEETYQNFAPMRWADLCIRLRRMLPRLCNSIGLVKTAMIIAFISAVETNLLNLVVPSADAVERLFYAKTLDHLERYLGEPTP